MSLYTYSQSCFHQVEGVSIEIEDSHGMTPLMHAAWKGVEAITEYLIKQGKE